LRQIGSVASEIGGGLVGPAQAEVGAFRVTKKFFVMRSGNGGPSNPVDLLDQGQPKVNRINSLPNQDFWQEG